MLFDEAIHGSKLGLTDPDHVGLPEAPRQLTASFAKISLILSANLKS